MSSVGVKVEQFKIPVCNSFQEKILYNQRCFEFDPYKSFKSNNTEQQLKKGLTFLMDYNEDKQATLKTEESSAEKNIPSLQSSIEESNENGVNSDASIYLDTIGDNLDL